MEQTEIQRLAAMGNALRPDWHPRSLATFIDRNLASRAYADVAVALAWVATRTKTDTPRLLLEAGAWWQAAATGNSSAPRPPKPHEACADCGRRENDHDHPHIDHAYTPLSHATRGRDPGKAALARAELHTAQTHVCSHGIRHGLRCEPCGQAATTEDT